MYDKVYVDGASGDGHYETLEAALSAVNSGGEVIVSGVTVAGETVTGSAANKPDFTVTDALFLDNRGANAGALEILSAEATVTGATFTGNSYTSNNGQDWRSGAIRIDGSTVTIENSTFNANTGWRGAIFVGGTPVSGGRTTLTLRNTVFNGNTSEQSGIVGGAIFIAASADVIVENCSFLTATDRIGLQGNLTLKGTVVTNGTLYRYNANYATYGDGLNWSFGNAGSISLDRVYDAGDGIVGLEFNNAYQVAFHSAQTFAKVRTVKVGGALTGTIAANVGSLSGDVAVVVGGATTGLGVVTAIDGGKKLGVVKYTGSSLTYNSGNQLTLAAAASGDFTRTEYVAGYTGITNVTGGTHEVSGLAVSGNTATTIAVTGGLLKLADSAFVNNAGRYAGAIEVSNSAAVEIRNTFFGGNTYTDTAVQDYASGAIRFDTGSGVIEGATFSGNHSWRGAIFVGGAAANRATLTVRNTIFDGNDHAWSGYGGAMFITATADVVVENSSFLTGADAIGLQGNLTLKGDVVTNGTLYRYNTTYATYGDGLNWGFGIVSDTNYDRVYDTGDGIVGLEFNNTGTVHFNSAQTFANVRTVKVSGGKIGVLATNAGSLNSAANAVFAGNTVKLNQAATLADARTLGAVTYSGNTLSYATGGTLTLAVAASGPFTVTDFIADYSGRTLISGGSHAISGAVFSGNTHSAYGAAVNMSGGVAEFSDTTFSGNTALGDNYGGGAYIGGGTANFSNVAFTGNRAARGGGLFVATGATATVADSVFSGNAGSLGGDLFVQADAVTLVRDTTFNGAICVQGALTLSDVTLNSSIYHYNGSITVADGALIFGANLGIYSGIGLTMGDNAEFVFTQASRGMGFRDSAGGTTYVQDFSGAATTTIQSAATTAGTYTVVSGVTGFSGKTVTVNGEAMVVDGAGVVAADTAYIQKAVQSGTALSVQTADTIYIGFDEDDGNFQYFDTLAEAQARYATFTGRTVAKQAFAAYSDSWTEATVPASLTVGGDTVALTWGVNAFGSYAAATELLASGGTLAAVDKVLADQETLAAAGAKFIVSNGSSAEVNGGTAYISGNPGGSAAGVAVVLENFHIGGDQLHLTNSGVVNGDWNVSATGLDAAAVNPHTQRGYAYLVGGSVTGNAEVAIRDSAVSSLYVLGGSTRIDGNFRLTVTDSGFSDSLNMCASSAEGKICSDVIYTITDTFVAGGVYGGGSNDKPTIDGDVDITLIGSTVLGGKGVTGSRGNNVTGSIGITLAGSTVSTVRKHDDGKTNVTAELTLTVTGATVSAIGSLSDVDNLVIDAGASANFTAAQDLSGVALTVDAADYAGAELAVATGVAAIGSYTISNKGAYSEVALYVVDDVLYLGEAKFVPTDTPQASFTGGTLNRMTGGTVTGAFFGTANASGDVTTTISGGTVGNAVIGGAKVTKGNTAALDNVTLNIAGGELAGGPDNGGQLYTAGYAYGASESALDADVTLSVTKSELNLTGGTIAAQNLFAGAHARKGARTVVNETVITVTDGTYKRIYGGGWAEKTARSEVGAASITVSGGSVEYIYAGGANAAGGETVTGSATISVSGDAAVDFIFLAGKNANCSVTNDAAVTLSGDAKSLVRISGRNGNGADKTGGTTSLNVQTDVAVHYLDYVDRINLAQGNEFSVLDMAVYSDGSDALINFELDGAVGESGWTALSGAACEAFQNATFAVNGVAVEWKESGQLGGTDYVLTFKSEEKKFIISDLA